MRIVQRLSVIALRELAGDGTHAIVEMLSDITIDRSQRLTVALSRATERAWRALEIALAGESLWGFLDAKEDKVFRGQVRAFLNSISFGDQAGSDPVFRKQCLHELRQVTSDAFSDVDIAELKTSFQRYVDPQKVLNEQRQVIDGLAQELHAAGFEKLGWLLSQQPRDGQPLLVMGVRYFFRRAVEQDAVLARGLAFAQQETLARGQEEGFTAVATALEQQGQRLDEALSGIHGTVAETHRKVLDLQAEVQRQGNLQHGKATETNSLLREVLEKISEAGMQRGEVRPQHSFSIRGEDERLAVKRLLERFRQLPEEQQREVPALLNGLGKLQLGAGDFAGARQSFTQVADTVTDNAARAEAHYNAYRAALEEKKWDTALREMKEAAALDAQCFSPFPLERYEPKDILGAGGFGTAFLCRDHNFGEDVVVKALHAGDLERNTSDLFQEARLLRRLNHPAIIGVQECAFAQPAQKSRPYIVMDYFPGASLQAYLQIYGTLETEDAVAIARQVAAGIHTAHANHILHRDLKPDNILVRKDQDGWQVKIIDFGLALRKQTIETS